MNAVATAKTHLVRPSARILLQIMQRRIQHNWCRAIVLANEVSSDVFTKHYNGGPSIKRETLDDLAVIIDHQQHGEQAQD
ncbi:hypothetical protein BV898_00756 [Hypsibius exemplaris]|uniref:Uncharacterized protein n=1 Tax=Hypsibius exemplaris TaxID=2072580 RepID=A0A1W0XEQ3_HYPEX|nr:hypothetical protein BV898_00756 [Hypsibius exemplaris]